MNTKSRWAPKKKREFENLWTPIPNCGRLYFLRRLFPFVTHARPVSGNASACERAQEPSAYPKSTSQRVAVSQNSSVPAELQRFLEQHRPPQPETANGSTSPKRPSSRVSFKSGLVYEGQLRRHDIMPLGWGRVTLPEGATYEGEWSGGRVHGKGALRLPNGNAYWGSWALRRKHGLGTFVRADCSRHHGYYRAGIKSGVGTLHYASGAVFEG